MRISVLLFATLVILVDATRASGAEQVSEPIDTLSPALRARTCSESFSQSSTAEFNSKCVALAGSLAAMRGDVLVLRMDNGNRKIFDNKDGGGASEGGFGYGLADFYPSTHIFVVCDHGVDASHCKAVDGKTGRVLDFGYAFPKFSPDGNWVLAVEYSNDEETDSNFAILDVRGKKQLTVWTSKASKTPLPPKADFVGWTDDKTIMLASPGQKPVSLIRASDDTWGVNTTPAN